MEISVHGVHANENLRLRRAYEWTVRPMAKILRDSAASCSASKTSPLPGLYNVTNANATRESRSFFQLQLFNRCVQIKISRLQVIPEGPDEPSLPVSQVADLFSLFP